MGRRSAFWIAIVPFVGLVWRFQFVCDDAFISLRYAKNLAAGLGLRYNVGVEPPVEGYSNFLWVLWLATFEWLGADATVWARLSSAACGILLLWRLVDFLRERLRADSATAAVSAVFFATLPPVVIWSTGGLATMPFALALFLLYERLLGNPQEPHAVQAGLLAIVLALLRTDGALWAALILGLGAATALVAHRPRLLRAVGIAAGMLLLGATAHVSWRYLYYGDYLSNTVRAKVGFALWILDRGGRYLGHLLLTIPSIALAVALPVVRGLRENREVSLHALAVTGATFAYCWVVGGDFMSMGRFLVPAMPFVTVLFAAGLMSFNRTVQAKRRSVAALSALALGLSVLPMLNLHIVPHSVRAKLDYRWGLNKYVSEFEKWDRTRRNAERWSMLGKAMREHGGPGESLVAMAIGAVGYYSGLFIYDRVGLVTRRVLEREGAGFDREERGQSPGHDTLVSPVFFLQDQPTYLRARVRPNAAGAGPSEIPIDASFASRNIVPDDLPRDGSHVLETIPLRTDQGFPPGTVLLRIKRVE
jgi:hypothetical protein